MRQQFDGKAGWMFLLGAKVNYNIETLQQENEMFGDILQGDFFDGYQCLPHKTIMSYIWINKFCNDSMRIDVKIDYKLNFLDLSNV